MFARCLVAAALAASIAGSASAEYTTEYYVAQDPTTKKCTIIHKKTATTTTNDVQSFTVSIVFSSSRESLLVERASRLLRLGDIGAARMILAFADDNGSARAAFMLAETYDPLVLSTWAAAGTRADPAKARELYARAYAAGIPEAKERSGALLN